MAIRSNHGVWLPRGQKVRVNKWRAFKHLSWDGKEETRLHIREIIYGKRRTIQYWQITTDKKTISNDSSWFVMTKILEIDLSPSLLEQTAIASGDKVPQQIELIDRFVRAFLKPAITNTK